MGDVVMKAKLSPTQGGRLLQRAWALEEEVDSLKSRLEAAESLLLEHAQDYEHDGDFDENEWHERVIALIEHRLPQADDTVTNNPDSV